MTEKVRDLEIRLRQKDLELNELHDNEFQIKQKFQIEIDQYAQLKKDRDSTIAKLERQLKDRDYDIQQLNLKNKSLDEETRIMQNKLDSQDK